MASVQGDSGVTDFGVISSRPGFMLHAEIQGKQVLVPVSGLTDGLGDKFLPMQGEDNGIPGQYAIGYGSKTRWNKKNPPYEEEYTDPVPFTAVGTYEGVTQTYEDIAGIIIDKAQGASASVTYGGKVFDIPAAPAGSGLFQTGFVVFPEVPNVEEEFYLPQLAPWAGLKFFDGDFQVISAEKVEGGWGVIFGTAFDASEDLPPLFPSAPEDEIFAGIVVLDVTAGENWQDDYGTAYAIGDYSIVSGSNSIAIGLHSTASGNYSLAIGDWSTASGEYNSITIGYRSTASGDYSIASGANSTASGDNSIASGAYSTASGDYSVASGSYSTASGDYSVASGSYSRAIGSHSTASGDYSIASGAYSTAIGHFNKDDATKIFIIGNGSALHRESIFTIDYNGKPNSAKIPSVNGGDLVVLGITPPATSPTFAGQIYLDVNNKKLYVAKATTATTDWVAIN